MYKYNHNLLPNDYDFKCIMNNELHHCNTPSSSLCHLPTPKTTRFKNSLHFKGPALWNDIPLRIRSASSLEVTKLVEILFCVKL